MMKLKPFNKVRHATKNQARFICSKCRAKVQYVASIGNEKVCKSCYNDFRSNSCKQ